MVVSGGGGNHNLERLQLLILERAVLLLVELGVPGVGQHIVHVGNFDRGVVLAVIVSFVGSLSAVISSRVGVTLQVVNSFRLRLVVGISLLAPRFEVGVRNRSTRHLRVLDVASVNVRIQRCFHKLEFRLVS